MNSNFYTLFRSFYDSLSYINVFLFVTLSIVCICTMFSEVMFILQILWSRFYLWVDHLAACRHLGNFFKNNCVMYCFVSIFAPCKWSMVFAKYSWYCFVIFVLEHINDQKSCVLLVFIKFFAFQTTCTWDFSVHIICMSCSIARNSSSCLCPACCP